MHETYIRWHVIFATEKQNISKKLHKPQHHAEISRFRIAQQDKILKEPIFTNYLGSGNVDWLSIPLSR